LKYFVIFRVACLLFSEIAADTSQLSLEALGIRI
jgi:hypothetical protein